MNVQPGDTLDSLFQHYRCLQKALAAQHMTISCVPGNEFQGIQVPGPAS